MKDARRLKKLIEVALPLNAINEASAKEKSIRHGHPSTLHLWWARRPLAAARAVIFAQILDDPSSRPQIFTTDQAQEDERLRLFQLISDLVQWENIANEEVISRARAEIRRNWREICLENRNHPDANKLFNPEELPLFCDPVAGGGSLPLEAQRLGLKTISSDLNPVAVLINKAMIEIPPKFAGKPPVNADARADGSLLGKSWQGTRGLADDVRYYGSWMRTEAATRIGHLYPKVVVSKEMANRRPDLLPLLGKHLTVVAWIWARTVRSPNPAFAGVEVPLAASFLLSKRVGHEAYIEPVIKNSGYHFTVKTGKPKDLERYQNGTKLARGANFRCLMSGVPIAGDYIKSEGRAGRMGSRLMAIIAESERGRVYRDPTAEMDDIAQQAPPEWRPETPLPNDPRSFWTVRYGLTTYGDLFTARQLVALATFSGLVTEVREKVKADAASTAMPSGTRLEEGGVGAEAYADAIAVYLALGVGRSANYWSALTPWGGEFIVQTFGRQTIPMVWDHAEGNPFSKSTGNWNGAVDWIEKVIALSLPGAVPGNAVQRDAQSLTAGVPMIISTDPPYYDNIPYADLSDFFYVWLRRSLKPVFPGLFATLSTPKDAELVAIPYRHANKDAAEAFFLDGMTKAMRRLVDLAHPAFPVTIYYAFKQTESDKSGTASTGWETFLDAVIRAGFSLTGTWPIRTERDQGLKTGTNVLASSIILVCRPRSIEAPIATRRDVVAQLRSELPSAVLHLQRGSIAPVDLAQAAIGPGMSVYTRYAKIIAAEGATLTVRDALTLINDVLDEVLTQQEGDLDADSRWAIAWFDQYGFGEGPYGEAETLSKAKNTSLERLKRAAILRSSGGKVRLLKVEELVDAHESLSESRTTDWEILHYLIRALETAGEDAAAVIVTGLGAKAEMARELAYRLYAICERRKRATEALSYNGLAQSWPEIMRLARSRPESRPMQAQLFEQG